MAHPSDRFDTLDVLGTTDHSVVIRGQDKTNDEVVAVKMVRPGAVKERRFQREVSVMRACAGTHVMPILDADSDGEWYSMPIALRELTVEINALSVTEREHLAYGVIHATAEGLRKFHARGQVHRDLKPSNILWLDTDGVGRWVVSDFGIARNEPGATTSAYTRTGAFLGTHGWAAPELHTDAHSADPTADVYSLGVIVGWILTGTQPTPTVVPRPADKFRAVVARATRSEPSRRFGTVDEMLAEMESELDGVAGPPSTHLQRLLASPIDHQVLSRFALAHSDNGKLLLNELPTLDRSELSGWFGADPQGLLTVATRMCEMLQHESDRGGLRYEGLRPPLIWLLEVLKLFIRRNQLEMAESFGTAFFEAVQACDQYPVGDAVARWMKSLNEREAQTMIDAARASAAVEYLKAYLERDWTEAKSQTLRRWMT